MRREKQLAKNTLIISFGTILPKMVNVITLPIITACLTKAEYGEYDLISTLVFLILPITTLQIHSAAFRYLIDYRDRWEEVKKIISTLFFFVLTVSAITVIIIGIVMNWYPWQTRILICTYFYADMIFLVLQQIARGLSQNHLYSISAVLNAGINLVIVLLALKVLDQGLNGVLIALTLAALGGCLFLAISLHIWNFFEVRYFKKSVLKELLSYSWPMIPNNISGWVLKLSDRLVITFFLGAEANAVYAVANKIPNLLSTFQSTFTYAWQENASLAAKDADVDKYYSNVFDAVFNMLVGVMSLLIAGTPIMFTILIRGDYDAAYEQMPILFIGMLFSSMASILGGIYIAHKRTKDVGISTVFAAITNLVIDLLTVKWIGITAGSVSTLISYLLLVVYRMYDVQKFQKIKFKIKKILLLILFLTVMCVICEQRKLLFDIINLLIGFFAAILLNKNLVIGFKNKIAAKIGK